MKILIIHNRYLEEGGEDEVVKAEIKLLEEHGHKVVFYSKSNEYIRGLTILKRLQYILAELSFSRNVYREVKDLVIKERPDIAHVHNIFICITPSVYAALKEENVPIVQTLHNYRFFCLNGTFFRKGAVCEECRNRKFFNGVMGRCWRGSFVYSFLMARFLYLLQSFSKNIDSYIALSKFSRDKFIEFGLEADKIYLKPNLLSVEPEAGKVKDNNYALFIGRLVGYKGINTLLKAFKSNPVLRLKIIGDGPLKDKVKSFVSLNKNIEYLGKLGRGEVIEAIRNSSFVVVPSEWYEHMPMVILESFALSKALLASNIGAIKEFVIDRVSGILFDPGNERDLAEKIFYLFSHTEDRLRMGKNAKAIYQEQFNKEKNYNGLMDIYIHTMNSIQKHKEDLCAVK